MIFDSSVKSKVQVGDSAPDFTLPEQSGEMINLKSLLKEKCVVLYFYPKDNTPGCTAEACSFRDQYEVFKEAGAEVVGVSSDSVNSHKKFASKHKLPFLLLSDRHKKVRKLYGVASVLGVLPGRETFVIDRSGIVRYIFSSQFHAIAHVEESLKILKNIQSEGGKQ